MLRPVRISRLQIGLLVAYLGIAPVRWLPGVDIAFWRLGKLALFVAAVGLAFSCVARRGHGRMFRLPAGLAGPLGFAALGMLSVPGMVQAPEYARAALFLMDLVYGAAFAWCFYNIARVDQRAAQRILAGGTMLFASFVAVAVALRLEGSFDSAAGCGVQHFRTAAFGCGSTSWSIAMAVYAALPLVFALRRDLAWDNRILYAGLFLLFFAAAAIAGGRGGLLSLAATSAVLLLALLPGRIKWAAALAAAALAVALPGGVALPGEEALATAGTSAEQATPLQQALLHFHLERLAADMSNSARGDILENLDYFSAGRVGQFVAAAQVIGEQPLTGIGIGVLKVPFLDTEYEVHNLWLSWAAASGVLAPMLFAALVAVLLGRAWRLARRRSPLRRSAQPARQSTAAACAGIVLAGVGASMFEGPVPLGEFQNTAIWWAAAGIILGVASAASERREHPGANPGAHPI